MTLNTPGFEETQTRKSVRNEISVMMEKLAIDDDVIGLILCGGGDDRSHRAGDGDGDGDEGAEEV